MVNQTKKKEKEIDKKAAENSLKNIINNPKIKSKIKEILEETEKFKKKVVDKFGDYILGITILPKSKDNKKEDSKKDDNKVRVLVLVDDSDSKKMSKEELESKLSLIIKKFAEETSKLIEPETLILSKLWQNCYDGDYEKLREIASSAIIYDKGMMSAIKIAEIHKTMVLQKFEKYIVSYVLAGSLVKGRATKNSDIDVWIVIDDTDVKRMSRAELKDKLRAIIIKMGLDAGEITGIRNKLNIQVYILTDFWDSLRDANPVIFTLLRDGVPFYDRGIFMPWKYLLKMGRIKPSIEAINIFKASGKEMLTRVKGKLRDIGTEDLYYAILTPAQAALMLYGLPPQDPRETAEMLREIFVKKEKLLEDKYVKTLEKVIQIRKDIEHGVRKEVTGKEIDEIYNEADKFLKRIDRLFSQVTKMREEEHMKEIYNTIVNVVRDALKTEGVEYAKEEDLLKEFQEKLINTGKIPKEKEEQFKKIIAWKKEYDNKTISKAEIEEAFKESQNFIKDIIEFVQRRRFLDIEQSKIRVKYGKGDVAEIILLEGEAVVYPNVKDKKKIWDIKISDGEFKDKKEINEDEASRILKEAKTTKKGINKKLIESVEKLFGDNAEIMLNY